VKHFVGLLTPTAGSVEVFGTDTRTVGTAELVRDVGFVFQYPEHQFVRDTVRSEIALGLQLLGTSPDAINEQVGEMLRVFGLEEYEHRHPFSLSGGLKRRLSVATVLVSRPRLIVLDEPTHGQDRASTESMISTLLDIVGTGERASGATLVMVTHDMRFVAEHARRVVALKDGLIAYDGGVADLFARPELMESVNIEEPPVRRLAASLLRSTDPVNVPYTVQAFASAVRSAASGDGAAGRSDPLANGLVPETAQESVLPAGT
jgi:energy-coupling factor transport system ATP-binding protein